jgi:YegS/Rv2252/BmrU family lipid kinase
MARWQVFVNRAAGSRAVEPAVVAEALRAERVDGEIVVPESAAQMVDLVTAAAKEGTTHFAVVGGDGTVNLTVNALLDLDAGLRPVIGVLPAGTGCDLLRTFGLPQDLGGAARHLATEEVYDIDVATLEGGWGRRYFVNVAEAGVGAAAVQTSGRMRRRLGAARYPHAFAARLPRFPESRVTVVTERRTYESEALAVILANGQFFAGGWNVAPKASLIDGLVDIQIFNCKKTRAPALVPKIIKGTHLPDPAVRRFSAAEFTVETDPSWPVECDGDLIGNTTVRGRVLPAAISLKI